MENANVIKKLSENYINLEQSIIAQLNIVPENSENIWLPVFKRIVPTKYNVETNVYIIDSYKTISPKVSIAIYDEQYTPYIFNFGTLKYIPIEAVFAVVHCGKENAVDWLTDIQKLKTDMNAYVRVQADLIDTHVDIKPVKPRAETQTATRPITILCTTKATVVGQFDIVLGVENNQLTKEVIKEGKWLTYWYSELNHFDIERYGDKATKLKALASKNIIDTTRTLKDLNVYKNGKDGDLNVLLSLTFQLNQLLMLINNPMFFPHQSYVTAFQEVLEKEVLIDDTNGTS